MAQYGYGNNNGGYSTTSYGAQGGADGGGFMGGSQGGSQAEGGKGSAYGKDTLRPCTIKQIIDATQPHPDAEFKIANVEITQLTFIGQIQSISTQATNVTYKVDDGTGIIEVKQWIDSDAPASESAGLLVEKAFVRVWGRLKAFNGKRHVGAHVIRAVTDMNEIAMHLLEATYVHLYFTRGPPETVKSEGGAANGGGGNDGGMFVDQKMGGMGGGDPTRNVSMSPTARKVFQLLQNVQVQNNEGLHAQTIATQLGMASAEVFKAGDELLSKGVIYTTVDDETWAVLEY